MTSDERKSGATQNVGALFVRWPLISVLFGIGYAFGRSLAGSICGVRGPFAFDDWFAVVSTYYVVEGLCVGLLLAGICAIAISTGIGKPWTQKLTRFSIAIYGPLSVIVGVVAGSVASNFLGPLHGIDCIPHV